MTFDVSAGDVSALLRHCDFGESDCLKNDKRNPLAREIAVLV